jgi:hypothetical protein
MPDQVFAAIGLGREEDVAVIRQRFTLWPSMLGWLSAASLLIGPRL